MLTKKVLKNLGYLSILNVVNMVSPLIVIPYLLRILGSRVYGEIIYTQSVVYYLTIFIGFGFNIIAVREVAIDRDNKIELSKIVSKVLLAKGILLLVTFLGLVVYLLLSETSSVMQWLMLLSMWSCLQEMLLLDWYFQGIEQMKTITIVNFISKLISTLAIFVFTNTGNDILIVPLSYLIGTILASIYGLYVVFNKHGLNFVNTDTTTLLKFYKESSPIFVSKLSQLYIRLNKVLIGVYLGSVEVAYFDVAEKVVSIFKLPITLYGQVIFPGFVKDRSTKLIIQSIVLFIGLHILFIGGIYFYSEDILKILTGMNDIEMYAKSTITILSLALIPILFNVFLGNTVLFGLGYQNQYSVTLIVGGIVYCVIGVWIFYNNAWSLQNMAWMVLCSELGCFTMTTIFFLLQKKHIQSKLSQ